MREGYSTPFVFFFLTLFGGTILSPVHSPTLTLSLCLSASPFLHGLRLLRAIRRQIASPSDAERARGERTYVSTISHMGFSAPSMTQAGSSTLTGGKNSVCSLGDGVVVLLLVEEIVKDGVL